MNDLSAPWSVYDTPWFARPGFEAYAEAYRNPPNRRIPRPRVDHYWTGEPIEIEAHPKGRWKHNGYVIYEGPSRFDGKPIVVIATGFREQSDNVKTGVMIQTWILRADMSPQDTVWAGEDNSICGTCVHRGEIVMVPKRWKTKAGTMSKGKRLMAKSSERSCYVQVSEQPKVKYQFYKAGRYPKVPLSQLAELFRGAPPLRIGSYGDPVAAPAAIWQAALEHQVAWTGYTHAWKSRTANAFKSFCMASVDTPAEQALALSRGWRTFRIGRKNEPLIAGVEIICPATPEGGMRTTCDSCNLCMGAVKEARSIVTAPHGSGKVGMIERRGKRLPSLNPSPGHTHPMLAEPVPRGRVVGELYDLYYQAGLPGDPELSWPNSLTKKHAEDPRRYAQVFVGEGDAALGGRGRPRIELAEQVRWLPRPNRRGLLAHEIGHVLDPGGSEDDADRAAYEATGVQIGYDHRWPGKGLQVARSGNPPREYWVFSYGSNDPSQVRDRVGRKPKGYAAIAHGYERVFRGFSRNRQCGVASLNKKRGGTTYGWAGKLTAAELTEMDRWEGVNSGNYVRKNIDIEIEETGETAKAITYIATSRQYGAPSQDYLRACARTVGTYWGDVKPSDFPLRNNPDERSRRDERAAASGDPQAQQRVLAERRRRGQFRPSMDNLEEYLDAFPGQTMGQIAGFWGAPVGNIAMTLGALAREDRVHSNYVVLYNKYWKDKPVAGATSMAALSKLRKEAERDQARLRREAVWRTGPEYSGQTPESC